ncbi:hypothetical protein CEXT_381931 [Caerostris extrusa]|uniref:Uncharacterized protein n=1 Tax=Caerostris extrusa TaxID=172846 RepID=A0AAV4WDL9_CAEEX|nr:hypothetical protein CEXT_381931 [Caerostris extrusa]
MLSRRISEEKSLFGPYRQTPRNQSCRALGHNPWQKTLNSPFASASSRTPIPSPLAGEKRREIISTQLLQLPRMLENGGFNDDTER